MPNTSMSPLKSRSFNNTKKRNIPSNHFWNKKFFIPLVIFTVLFGGVGIYKLKFSSAASTISCDRQWREVPGGGRALSAPDLNLMQFNEGPYGNSMMLVVRGTDNGVYFQPLRLSTAGWFWDGSWRRLNNGSTIGIPRQENFNVQSTVYVVGTDGNSYKTSHAPGGWTPWAYIGPTSQTIIPGVSGNATYGNKYVAVRREPDNRISYYCETR